MAAYLFNKFCKQRVYERTPKNGSSPRAPGFGFSSARRATPDCLDLLPAVREHYYHRDILGSFSIKAVLPTLAPELDYGELGEVRERTAAQRVYAEAVHPSTGPERS